MFFSPHFFLIFSYSSGSNHAIVDVFIELSKKNFLFQTLFLFITYHFCGKRPQAVGTINDKLWNVKMWKQNNVKSVSTHKHPTPRTWIGACNTRIRCIQWYVSNFSIITGKINIPGAHIVILDIITWVIPLAAATLDCPMIFPFSSEQSIPFKSSFWRIIGIFTQFAAATAAKGTYL